MSEIDKSNWYCIKFDTPKNITALEFSRKMNAFLEEIDAFNHSIVNGIDETYTVASYVEDFETGSVKWWLLDKLQKTDDKAIEKFVNNPVKTTIAGILKFAKTKAIEGLQNSLTKDERQIKIINPIIEEIEKNKSDLQRHELSAPIKLNEDKMFASLSNMSNIAKSLDGKVSFIEKFEDNKENEKAIAIPQNFEYVVENNNISTVETEEVFPSQTINAHIKVYKACFEKTDKWQFTLNGKTETIDISESDIVSYMKNKFINGDTFYVKLEFVERKTKTGYTNDYKVIEILTFTRGSEQPDFDL